MNDNARLKPAVAVKLSRDELAFLLRLMGLPRLPGFTIPADADDSALAAAARSLRARGIGSLDDDGQYRVDSSLAAIVAAGATFSRLLASTIVTDHTRHPAWIYFVPGLTVLHREIQPDVHQFETIGDGFSMILALTEVLSLDVEDDAVHDVEEFSLPRAVFKQTQDTSEDAEQFLAEYDLPPDFVEAVVNKTRRIVVSLVQATADSDTQADSLLFIEGTAGYWRLIADNDMLWITSIRNQDVLDSIASLVTNDL